RAGPDAALPPLLGRTLAAGQRAVVLCGSPERVAALDAALWACESPDWLPHGAEGGPDAELQPIWLTTTPGAPNGARFLFLVEIGTTPPLDGFDRVFDLFDGNNDEAVAAARRRWTAAKAEGHALTYWQQGPGGWAKKG
ncbi:MAG TPA: DNA polymerase III subunit chi, partial [Acetobacteraceae bacterium]